MRMTVNEAVRELRRRSQESQQVFATKLNLSLRAYQKYEQEQTPEPRALNRFLALAEQEGWQDLAQAFRSAVLADLAHSLERNGIFTTADRFETLAVITLLAAFNTKQPEAHALAKNIAAMLTREFPSDADKWIAEAELRGFMKKEKK